MVWNQWYYLCKPSDAEILSNVIVREVTKPSHPNICSNKDTYCIVYLCRSKIMVHQEYDLFQEKKIKKKELVQPQTLCRANLLYTANAANNFIYGASSVDNLYIQLTHPINTLWISNWFHLNDWKQIHVAFYAMLLWFLGNISTRMEMH